MINTTILVDVDDTAIDLCEAWCKWLNSRHGTCVSKEDITEWDIYKFFPDIPRDLVYEPLRNDSFWETVEAKPDAISFIEKLIDEGFNIYFCTSTDYRNVKPKYEKVISKYFPFIPWENMIVAHRKQMINADFLIDDGIHNLAGGKYIKILMSAPHNRNYDAETNHMFRVENWKEAYGAIHFFLQT